MANSSLESVIKVNGSIVSELSERIPSNIVALYVNKRRYIKRIRYVWRKLF